MSSRISWTRKLHLRTSSILIWESVGSESNASVEYFNGTGIALVEVESGTVKNLSTGVEVNSLEICVVAGYDEFCNDVGIDYEIDFDAGSASVNAVVGCGNVELLWGIPTGEEELERVVTKDVGGEGEAIVEIVLHKEIGTVLGVVCGIDVNAASFDGATLEDHRELQSSLQ